MDSCHKPKGCDDISARKISQWICTDVQQFKQKSDVRTLNSKAPTQSLCHLPEGAGLTQNQIKHLQLISAEDFFLKCSNQLLNYDPRTDLHCHQIERHYTVRSRCFYNSWPSWKGSPQNTIIFAGFLSKKQSEQKPEKEFIFKTDVYMCWGLTHFYHHYP